MSKTAQAAPRGVPHPNRFTPPLERIRNEMVARLGWAALGRRIDIRCFNHEPRIASRLKFLRRTLWAREQVEALYLVTLRATAAATDRKALRSGPKA